MIFETWTKAYNYQQKCISGSDNSLFNFDVLSNRLLDIPFSIKDSGVLFIIMAEDFQLEDYEENAIEYGVKKNKKWAALEDGHCS